MCSAAANTHKKIAGLEKWLKVAPAAFYIDSPGPRSSCQSRNILEGTASWWTAAKLPLLALGRSCSKALPPWSRCQTLPHPGHPVCCPLHHLPHYPQVMQHHQDALGGGIHLLSLDIFPLLGPGYHWDQALLQLDWLDISQLGGHDFIMEFQAHMLPTGGL
jgi:hypothetical protein